jgi:hypothetical protein
MDIVDAIEIIPRKHKDTIYKLNDLRNAIARGFIPENRRLYLKFGNKVMYDGENIYTKEGIEKFNNSIGPVYHYLEMRASKKSVTPHPPRAAP